MGGGAGCGEEEVQVTATSMTALVEALARRPWKGRADFGAHPCGGLKSKIMSFRVRSH